MESNINENLKPKQEVVQTQNTAINQQLEKLEYENEQLFLKITDILNAQCKQMRDNSNLKNILEQLSIKRALYKDKKNKLDMINKSHITYKENDKLKELLDDLNSLHKSSNEPFHILAGNYELNIKKEGDNYNKISKIYEKLNELLDIYEFKLKKIDYERRKKVTVALKTLMDAEHGFNNSNIVPELIEKFKDELKNLFYINYKNIRMYEKEEYISLAKELNEIQSDFYFGFSNIAKNFDFKNSIYSYTKLNNFVERFKDVLNKAKNLIKSGKIKKGIFLRNRKKEGYLYYKNEAISENEKEVYSLKYNEDNLKKPIVSEEKLIKIDFEYYKKLIYIIYDFLPGYGYDELYDKVLDLADLVRNHAGLYEFSEKEKAIIDEVDKRITEELKTFKELKADISKFKNSLYNYLCYLNQNVFSENAGYNDL